MGMGMTTIYTINRENRLAGGAPFDGADFGGLLFLVLEGFPQGLKPRDLTGLIGTTEVVPLHKTSPYWSFSAAGKAL